MDFEEYIIQHYARNPFIDFTIGERKKDQGFDKRNRSPEKKQRRVANNNNPQSAQASMYQQL